MTDEKLFKLFRLKLEKEFPDLQIIKLEKYIDGFSLIKLDLDAGYSEEGMNNLDKAAKKVIKKYFKLFLKYVSYENSSKYSLDDTIDEENIWILIK